MRSLADSFHFGFRIGPDACLLARVEPLMGRLYRAVFVGVPYGERPSTQANAVASGHWRIVASRALTGPLQRDPQNSQARTRKTDERRIEMLGLSLGTFVGQRHQFLSRSAKAPFIRTARRSSRQELPPIGADEGSEISEGVRRQLLQLLGLVQR